MKEGRKDQVSLVQLNEPTIKMYENNRKKEEMNMRREGDVCSSKGKNIWKQTQFEEGIYTKGKYK